LAERQLESVRSRVLAHYAAGLEEQRLETGPSRLEHARTLEILERYLPPAPGRIADVGGGPGRYAAWLATRGYDVDLLDLSPLHVEQASERFRRAALTGARAEQGDARELPYAEGSRDAVLLMGPMYHLPERPDRISALQEAFRVLRSGGVLVAAFISRFASLLDGFFGGLIEDPRFVPIVHQDLETGRHENPTDNPFYFTTAYLHHPDEIAPEVGEAGFPDVEVLAVEGPFWCLHAFDEQWSDASKQERLLRFVRQVETERSLLGASAHILAVARKG
jgi:SAM-dependent methyltransferase